MSFEPLSLWFKDKARDLPWRLPKQVATPCQNPDCYLDPWAVLVSEIMLQQTQVTTVLPYFKRWMERFPSYHELAKADEDEVMKMWEGLGYYRRAKNLQKAARYLVDIGGFPNTRQELLKIPGVGPYTSAAILAFAFHQKSVPVDGNVLRVASRYLASFEDISKSSTAKLFETALFPLLPQREPWIAAEALIELGATVCKLQNPACSICPLNQTCLAYQKKLVTTLPIKSKVQNSEKLWRTVAVIVHPSQEGPKWLACQKVTPGLFQGLWHFPYIEREEESFEIEHEVEKLKNTLELELQLFQVLKERKHSFTRFSAHLSPLKMKAFNIERLKASHESKYHWLDINTLKNLTFCSGHRQIRDELCQSSL